MNLFRKINKKMFKATVVVLFLFGVVFNTNAVFAVNMDSASSKLTPSTETPNVIPDVIKVCSDTVCKMIDSNTAQSLLAGGLYVLDTTPAGLIIRKTTGVELTDVAVQSGLLKKEVAPEAIYCLRWGGVMPGAESGLQFSFPGCLALGSYFILYLTSWILFFSSVFFDWTINSSLSMKNIFDNYKMISYGWILIRDLINLSFILIMVYIAISTILRSETYGYKKMLGKLVVAAILINFSMFFTKVIIDASNIVTLVFYRQINDLTKGSVNLKTPIQQGISVGIMDKLGMQEVWGVGKASKGLGDATSTSTNPAITAGQDVVTSMGGVALSPWKMILVGLAGSVFVLILSFIFLAAAIMFLMRMIVLIILVITSPVAFASNVLPQTSKLSKDWWSKLTSNALFAPVYMIMMFISLQMLWQGTGTKNGSLLAFFNSEDTSAIDGIFFFVFVCAMLIASLVVASRFGAWGGNSFQGKWSKKIGDGVKNFTTRNTAGRVFDRASRSTTLSKMATSNSAVGRFIGGRSLQGLDKLAQSKMGGDSSYRSRVEGDKKAVEARAKLAEANLKQKGGEADLEYFRRTGYLGKDMKKKGNESNEEYKKRTGITAEERDRAKDSVKSAINRAYGLDDKGNLKGGYLFRGSELAARGKVDTDNKKKTDTASTQIEKLKEKMFRETTKDNSVAGGAPVVIRTGTLLNSSKAFKFKDLKKRAEGIINSINKDNVEEKASDLRRLLERQHDGLKKRKDIIMARAGEHSAKAAELSEQANIETDVAKREALYKASEAKHNEYQRTIGEASFVQSDMDVVDKHRKDISDAMSKIEDLNVAKSQLEAVSGIKLDGGGDKK